jgi:hypothetical protein
MLVFVPLFQNLSKGDGEYKLLIVFVPRADFQRKGVVREPMV